MDPADQFHSPYTYVGGDPVNLIDPDGRQATSCGNGPRNCENAPVINVNIEDHPRNLDIDFGMYSDHLRARLVANGYSSHVRVEQGFPSPFQSLTRWWNETPSASVDIRDFNYLQDRRLLNEKGYDPSVGGYAEPGSDEAIVFTGNNTYNRHGNSNRPLWLYVNVTIHELGHASFGFEHPSPGDPTTIMDSRESSTNPLANFSESQQNTIRNSKWGSGND